MTHNQFNSIPDYSIKSPIKIIVILKFDFDFGHFRCEGALFGNLLSNFNCISEIEVADHFKSRVLLLIQVYYDKMF